MEWVTAGTIPFSIFSSKNSPKYSQHFVEEENEATKHSKNCSRMRFVDAELVHSENP
jgi:hypothetical protein